MLGSVQLTLMIGPVIPLTVPRVVLDSLSEVEVRTEDVGQSVWLHLVDRLAALHDPAALAGWLATTRRSPAGTAMMPALGRSSAPVADRGCQTRYGPGSRAPLQLPQSGD